MRVLSLLLLLGLLSPATTRAERREVHVFMPHYGYDIAFLAGHGALYFTARYAITPRGGDRAPLTGGGHGYVHRADVASDVTVGLVLYAMPVAGYLLDGALRRDFVRAFRVPIILMEAFTANIALVTLMKNLGVCRPYSWSSATERCGDGVGVPDDADEQRRALPSGHASSAAAMSGALVGLWLLPSGRDDGLAPLALGSTVLALVTSGLRVRAGAHSFADVSVGFGVGFALGLGTAALHTRTSEPRVAVSPTANGLMISGAF